MWCVARVTGLVFIIVNAFQVLYFVRNRISSTCMLFLSMYTLTMCLCEQRNSWPKRTE